MKSSAWILGGAVIGLGALALECVAGSWLLQAEQTMGSLWALIALHALASVLAGVSLALLIKTVSGPAITMFGVMNFLVPGLAPVFAGINALAIAIRRRALQSKIICVAEPSFFKDREKPQSGSRSMQIRPQLHNPKVPVARRLTALLAIQEVPARFSAALLRSLLSDGAEDIRLLSYGMLERREKTISDQILAERARLEAAATETDKASAQRLLAELYWEMVHQTLVVGDMRQHCLTEAMRFARLVLDRDPMDGGMALLYGKALLAASQVSAARDCFEGAARTQAARTRVLPYLAECAYQSADFERVRELMVELGEPHDMTIARCVEYWT